MGLRYFGRKILLAWILILVLTAECVVETCGMIVWADEVKEEMKEEETEPEGTEPEETEPEETEPEETEPEETEPEETDSEGAESEEDSDVLEEEIKVEIATPSDLTRMSLESGDLWMDWEGTMEFSGSGTPGDPYQIGNLAELMGFSKATALGEDFDDTCFVLTRDIDLGNLVYGSGNWNPIGWYENDFELAGDVAHPFRGHFDGAGNRISGLKIVRPSLNLKNIGLFGVIDGGTVRNLTLEADEVCGVENVGLLAGTVTGAAVIQNVEVSGYAFSDGNAGGIAAEVTGEGSSAEGQVTIENCRADGLVLNSAGSEAYVGGIAGNVQRAYLIDNTVITQNGNSNRIQGKGYVGGVAGRMRQTSIYNSYVNGTIGGNGSRAAGGIVGKYESGNLILARMAGEISRTNNGSASREGAFAGTRESRDQFTYGTEKDSRLAYLYTNDPAKTKRIFGSTIDGDNSYTESAHVGYWTDTERKYVTTAGVAEHSCGDRYFYEELEDGVRYIITQKLGKEYTADGYARNLSFHMDHFAPGYMGEPVRGYLLDIPRIDARNANGTWDTDVASLTALSETGSSYYRPMDKDHVAAVMPGAVVTVNTAPKNTRENRYQMAVSPGETGGVKPPTYCDEAGNSLPMNYVNGGAYSFVMPACDTVLNAEYVKVTTTASVDPAETLLQILQTRSGDRKAPRVVTEVKNSAGRLIARYIDGEPDWSVEVQPAAVHVELNGTGETVDRAVKWSVDDSNLIENRSETGYTLKDAEILPNLNSSFVQNIINREVQAQADNQYREKISNTVYTRYAVLTASTNPVTSADGQPVFANCRVSVTFQILDNTTVRVEGIHIDRKIIHFTITRRLTGSRQSPSETISCMAPVILTAGLSPAQSFLKNVSWSDTQGGRLILLSPFGEHLQECRAEVRFDPSGKDNPAWIQNVINEDNAKKAADWTIKLEGNGSCTEIVTVTSEDQTHGHLTDVCEVKLNFVTLDETTVYGGSSGGHGGGGGGSSKSTTSAGAMSAGGPSLPSYVVTGTWTQSAEGKWMFTDGNRTYANEWAAVYNPYANQAAGQETFDWFCFDAEGHMMTGWHTAADGNTYYLQTVSDGAQGRMVTGWNWIEGIRYYFNESADGSRGALKREYTAA